MTQEQARLYDEPARDFYDGMSPGGTVDSSLMWDLIRGWNLWLLRQQVQQFVDERLKDDHQDPVIALLEKRRVFQFNKKDGQ